MKDYQQGRMDAWERIDAIKRRLGMMGFFNEQKVKRYPKGHPKAGQFMDLPDAPIKAKLKKPLFTDIEEKTSTTIDGNTFSLVAPIKKFASKSDGSTSHTVVFLANGSTLMDESIDEDTKKKAAFWWRRQALDLPKHLPEGTLLDCSAEDGDGESAYRMRFYKAIGFNIVYEGDDTLYAKVKNGRLAPVSEMDLDKSKPRTLVNKAQHKAFREEYGLVGRLEAKKRQALKIKEEVKENVEGVKSKYSGTVGSAINSGISSLAISKLKDSQYDLKRVKKEALQIKKRMAKNIEVSARLAKNREERKARPPLRSSSMSRLEEDVSTPRDLDTKQTSKITKPVKATMLKKKGKNR